MEKILDFLTENWVWIAPALYEILVRVWPTKFNVSLLDNLWKIVNLIITNRRIKQPLDYMVEPNKNSVNVPTNKHILFSIVYVLMLLPAFSYAQIWQNFKGVRLVNVLDSTTVLPIQGSIYYNEQSDKFRVYQNGAWRDMIGSTSGGISAVKAGNGLTAVSSDSVVLGSLLPIASDIEINTGSFYLNIGAGNPNTFASAGAGINVYNGGVLFGVVDNTLTDLTGFDISADDIYISGSSAFTGMKYNVIPTFSDNTTIPAWENVLNKTGTFTNKTWNGIAIGTAYAGTPVGGTTGQVLTKTSNSNYSYSWQNVPTPSITNTSKNTELPRSNFSKNLVSSAIFSNGTDTFILGDSSSSGNRTLKTASNSLSLFSIENNSSSVNETYRFTISDLGFAFRNVDQADEMRIMGIGTSENTIYSAINANLRLQAQGNVVIYPKDGGLNSNGGDVIIRRGNIGTGTSTYGNIILQTGLPDYSLRSVLPAGAMYDSLGYVKWKRP